MSKYKLQWTSKVKHLSSHKVKVLAMKIESTRFIQNSWMRRDMARDKSTALYQPIKNGNCEKFTVESKRKIIFDVKIAQL